MGEKAEHSESSDQAGGAQTSHGEGNSRRKSKNPAAGYAFLIVAVLVVGLVAWFGPTLMWGIAAGRSAEAERARSEASRSATPTPRPTLPQEGIGPDTRGTRMAPWKVGDDFELHGLQLRVIEIDASSGEPGYPTSVTYAVTGGDPVPVFYSYVGSVRSDRASTQTKCRLVTEHEPGNRPGPSEDRIFTCFFQDTLGEGWALQFIDPRFDGAGTSQLGWVTQDGSLLAA